MPHPIVLSMDPALIERARAMSLRLGVTLDRLAEQGLVAMLERYAPPGPASTPFEAAPLAASTVGSEPGVPQAAGVKRWKRTDLRRRGLELPVGIDEGRN